MQREKMNEEGEKEEQRDKEQMGGKINEEG